MNKKVICMIIRKSLIKIVNYIAITLILCCMAIIMMLNILVPFFPILFLFNVFFWVGYPLFVKYVFKKKWFECAKNDYLSLVYIAIPWIILEILVLIYYHNETMLVIEAIIEGNA